MSKLAFVPLPPEVVTHYRAGGLDANGRPPEPCISNGDGNPCRACLCDIAYGEPMLIVGHKPFASRQPYAETGPVFLHAKACEPPAQASAVPPVIAERDQFLIRGYSADERIVEHTGALIKTEDLEVACQTLFQRDTVAFIHIRSATNGCFQCRVDNGADIPNSADG